MYTSVSQGLLVSSEYWARIENVLSMTLNLSTAIDVVPNEKICYIYASPMTTILNKGY